MPQPAAALDIELFDAQAFDAALAGGAPPLTLFRDTLRAADETLRRRWLGGRTATELVPARAHLIDELLCRAWRQFFDAGDSHAALVAVGGYGRGELHPGSDIDVLILLGRDPDSCRDAIESFLTLLWDIGLEIGHSVRTVEDCVQEAAADITVATNLQEARLLIGAQNLFDEQQRRCAPGHIWPGDEFFSAKWKEQTQRHLKFNDTAYNLEPNIKEGPGGLRDIQMIGWVTRRHFGTGHLRELVSNGFLTEQEYKTLLEGQALLWQIRFGLHVITGRREDRLLFDHQRTLAKHFGYQDDRRHLAVEQFMKEYYRTVMRLSRLNEMLLQLFQEEILYEDEPSTPVPINKRFQMRKGFLEVSDEHVFARYPFALLEVFLVMTQHPELKGVRANTIRLIRDHRHLIDPQFRDNLGVRSLFMEILRQHHGVTHELRRMNRYGILAAYLPVFGNIVGQMQHDLFHVYTVDEHTLFLVRNLRRFTVAEYRHEFPLCSGIMDSIPKQELLLIAGLFHDIAKGRGGDHSQLGACDAIDFCKHHGLSDYDARLVGWLVRSHLLMSTTAQRKDIDDPDVVHEFACQVGDRSRLDYLYLLTVADIRATSPKVWNSWKDSLLRELYYATRRALRRGLGNRIVQSELVAETRAEARKPLLAADIDDQAADALWQTLGDEYFLRYSPDEIVWHTRSILAHRDPDAALVLVRGESRRGGTEVVIYARESRALFALITAALDQIGLTIVDARIITTTDNRAIDTFLVLEEDGQPIREPQRLEEIRNKLDEYLARSELPAAPVTRHVPRQSKHFRFPTRVEFSQDESNRRTIMDVTAYDRPGILSQIGAALVDCDMRVRNAKIATFGERAEDIFYITDSNDQPLSQPQQFDNLTAAITRALGD